MPKSDFFSKIVEELSNALPSHFESFKKDFEKSAHRILNKTLDTFDLVTREEFAAQKKVLERTRQKLEALEEKIKIVKTALQKKSAKK